MREKHLFSERNKNISIKLIEILDSKADRLIKHFSIFFIDFQWFLNSLIFCCLSKEYSNIIHLNFTHMPRQKTNK